MRPGAQAALTVAIVRKQGEAERLDKMIRRGGWNRTTYWELRKQLDLKHETIACWRTRLEEGQ